MQFWSVLWSSPERALECRTLTTAEEKERDRGLLLVEERIPVTVSVVTSC